MSAPAVFVLVDPNPVTAEIARTALRDWQIALTKHMEFLSEGLGAQLRSREVGANSVIDGDLRAELSAVLAQYDAVDKARANLEVELHRREDTDE